MISDESRDALLSNRKTGVSSVGNIALKFFNQSSNQSINHLKPYIRTYSPTEGILLLKDTKLTLETRDPRRGKRASCCEMDYRDHFYYG